MCRESSQSNDILPDDQVKNTNPSRDSHSFSRESVPCGECSVGVDHEAYMPDKSLNKNKKLRARINRVNIFRVACRFDHFSKHFPRIMKSAKSGASSTIKKISKKDHALLQKLNKKSPPHGFSRPRAETENVPKYAGGENTAAFFDNFKCVQAKDTDSYGKATTRS